MDQQIYIPIAISPASQLFPACIVEMNYVYKVSYTSLSEFLRRIVYNTIQKKTL